VIAIGKIEDIFNHRGITKSDHASGNTACVDSTLTFLRDKKWRGLMFVNLVDTDMHYGHRRDSAGFAKCLEEFDARIPEILRALGDDGMLIITADHGCDPTFKGTDHTRERVPVLAYGLQLKEGAKLDMLGSFADVAATALEALGVKAKLQGKGKSFYSAIALDEEA
jgi:phosphopentomutase